MDVSYKATSVILANLGLFRGFWTPFGALGTQREFFRKKILQCTTRYENTTCWKISEKIGGRLSRISPDTWTHARTDGRAPLKTMVPLR